MSELEQTIEELEAEVLAELEEASAMNDPQKKGAAPAEGKKKVAKVTPGGEVEDGGEPVVDPEAKDSPTDVAADGADEISGDAQQKGEQPAEPMKKVKKVKEAMHDDDDEEMDDEEEEPKKPNTKNGMLKAMYDKKIEITATCVRIPVQVSHAESLNIEFAKSVTPIEIKKALQNSEGCKVIDEKSNGGYATPVDAEGKNDTFISRIRTDKSNKNSINLWIVSDNLLRGAALNAVEIAETYYNRNR